MQRSPPQVRLLPPGGACLPATRVPASATWVQGCVVSRGQQISALWAFAVGNSARAALTATYAALLHCPLPCCDSSTLTQTRVRRGAIKAAAGRKCRRRGPRPRPCWPPRPTRWPTRRRRSRCVLPLRLERCRRQRAGVRVADRGRCALSGKRSLTLLTRVACACPSPRLQRVNALLTRTDALRDGVLGALPPGTSAPGA